MSGDSNHFKPKLRRDSGKPLLFIMKERLPTSTLPHALHDGHPNALVECPSEENPVYAHYRKGRAPAPQPFTKRGHA
ncbi:hypothetical protein NPIL_51961 [Nephila pilipes]|uniref:Uncharacterized protein n=1 Tax=Nephila pilipes TaxID=299642 RepID=A0A8X6TXZ5_NEPPI|nr:hypothetical protein NPIL_51961 [Nephila pilipes]